MFASQNKSLTNISPKPSQATCQFGRVTSDNSVLRSDLFCFDDFFILVSSVQKFLLPYYFLFLFIAYINVYFIADCIEGTYEQDVVLSLKSTE
jgi:hypothetical protein